jgi:hypothetical protein
VRHVGQQLDLAAARGGLAELHEIQLARVGHPGGAMQRPVGLPAPPQADVELARAQPALVGGIEARQRAETLRAHAGLRIED